MLLPFAKTGGVFTNLMLMVLISVLLTVVPSLATNVTVRAVVVGVSLVLLYFTARNAACHCANVAVLAVEANVITPPALLVRAMLPMVAATGVKLSTS